MNSRHLSAPEQHGQHRMRTFAGAAEDSHSDFAALALPEHLMTAGASVRRPLHAASTPVRMCSALASSKAAAWVAAPAKWDHVKQLSDQLFDNVLQIHHALIHVNSQIHTQIR